MFIRCVKWLIVFAAVIQLCIYANDVHTRMIKGSTCQWHPVKDRFALPDDPPPPYSARYCYVEKYTILLQLFDADDRHLLAERMYRYLDAGSFFWDTDEQGRAKSLIYDTSDDGGEIAVPPTLLDRLRAKLP